MALKFEVRGNDRYTLVHFSLQHEILAPAILNGTSLPAQTLRRRHLGLVISGRGPVWLHAFLLHEAHAFAWVGIYDPRLGGAVVVSRHVPGAPEVGSLIPTEIPEEGVL